MSKSCRKGHSGGDANARGKSQHQPNHDADEVGSNGRINNTKHTFVPEFPKAKGHASWEEENEEWERGVHQ